MSEKNETRSRTSALGGVLKSFTKSLKPASGRVPVVINAKVVGGGSDLQKLLHQLETGTLSLRVSAAVDITRSLKTYSVSSIPEIWYLARDLCDQKYGLSVRRVAVNLMIGCIEHDSADVSSRLMYYRDILMFCGVTETSLDPELDLFISALVVLTDNGKEIHDLCVYNHNRNWTEFMEMTFGSLAYFFNYRAKHQGSNHYNDLVLKVASYLQSCFKYNPSVFEEAFVSSVLRSVMSISENTRDPQILLSLCGLVHTISLFAFIPSESRASTAVYLCSLAPLGLELHSASWNTMVGIFKVYPLETLDVVVGRFHAPELQSFGNFDLSNVDLQDNQEFRPLLSALGSLSLLEEMLAMCGSDEISESFDFSYGPLFDGLVQCAQFNIQAMNSGVLRMFDHLLALGNDESHRSSQLRFSALFPFHTWYASSGSIISLLLKLKISTSQDESYWTSICASLRERMESTELLAPNGKLVDLFLLHPQLLRMSEAIMVMDYYRDNNFCTIVDPAWKQNCRTVLSSFFPRKSGENSQDLRIHALRLLKDGLDKSRVLSNDDSIGPQCVSFILQAAFGDDCKEVIDYFLHTLAYEVLLASSFGSFQSLLAILGPVIKGHKSQNSRAISSKLSMNSSIPRLSTNSLNYSEKTEGSNFASNRDFSQEGVKLFARLLIETSISDSRKFKEVYDFAIDLLEGLLEQGMFQESLFMIRALMRVRATYEGFIFFCEPTDINGLASTFKRNSTDETFTANDTHWWSFPEDFAYLPKKQFNKPNNQILNNVHEHHALILGKSVVTLDLSKWLRIVFKILKECPHWEVYSYTLVHLCSQLFNLSLFWHLEKQVLEIQEIVCEQIMLKLPKAMSFSSDRSFSKSDLQVALVRILSSLIGYHGLFEKQNEDNLIKTLLFGLDAWSKTAIPCIHMLTVCCYEISDSLKRFLIPILTKLQTGVTSVVASASALEFLMALIHVPSLISYFTEDEYKQVFAICFRYIEHSLDAIRRGFDENGNSQGSTYLEHGTDAEMDNKPSTQKTVMTPILYQYLLIVSYAVIARWFLKIDVTERSRISSFIIKNIISCNGVQDVNQLDELTIAHLDAITRFTYSDIPLKLFQKSRSAPASSVSRWLIGHSIVEIVTDPQTGGSKITLRRPCGLSTFDLSLNQSMIPGNLEQNSNKTLMLSSHLLLQLFRPLDQGTISKPIALMDDAYTERAINAFDHLPVVAHHKAGILYIGPGQSEEAEILANTHGSHEYHRFLNGLGEMVKLDSCDSIYVGGLDKDNGTDGEYAYFWSDELTHLVYHTTTMMPNRPNDLSCAMKKRHIGNNHVNVFFDESGLPFNFNIIKSQFNFLNIVVSPHTVKHSGFSTPEREFYKVITYRRNGVPGIFSTAHFKLISLEQLPHLVRNIVIMSNRFSEIWHNSVDGVYTTSWQLRVRHIDTLRRKTIESQKQAQKEASSTNLRANSKNTTMSFLEQLQPSKMDSENSEKKSSGNGHVTSMEQDPYSFLEFNSYT